MHRLHLLHSAACILEVKSFNGSLFALEVKTCKHIVTVKFEHPECNKLARILILT